MARRILPSDALELSDGSEVPFFSKTLSGAFALISLENMPAQKENGSMAV